MSNTPKPPPRSPPPRHGPTRSKIRPRLTRPLATDASNYRQVPIGLVLPLDADVIATVAACREHGAPVLSRNGGTSLAASAATWP